MRQNEFVSVNVVLASALLSTSFLLPSGNAQSVMSLAANCMFWFVNRFAT